MCDIDPETLGAKPTTARLDDGTFIANGGFSAVYLWTNGDKRFAVKRMNARVSQPIRKNLEREVRTLRKLNHENIIRLHDVYVWDKTLYFLVLDYARTTLSHLVEKGFTKQVATKIARQLFTALAYCHENGIVHCDVKSSNVLLDDAGDVKLCDFGTSHTFKEVCRDTKWMGTLYYAPPEWLMETPYIANDEPYVVPSGDVWSAGIVLMEMAYKSIPVSGETPMDQLLAIFCAVGSPPERSNWSNRSPLWSRFIPIFPPNEAWFLPALDIGLDAVARQCLRLDPEQRPSSADVQRMLS